jgi:ClpX C4-type zinc finger
VSHLPARGGHELILVDSAACESCGRNRGEVDVLIAKPAAGVRLLICRECAALAAGQLGNPV